jgi:hypothetical protein
MNNIIINNRKIKKTVLSSFLFLLPTIYGHKNKQKLITITSFLTFIISVLNHLNKNNLINVIDRLFALINISYFGITYYNLNNIYYVLAMIVCILSLMAFYHFKISTSGINVINEEKNHVIIHICSCLGILLLIKSKI